MKEENGGGVTLLGGYHCHQFFLDNVVKEAFLSGIYYGQ